ncbi:MAG: hypothetical protein WCC01_13830 [Acidimicrobiia bacterium]
MTQDQNVPAQPDDLDELEAKLESIDAADAPAAAEEIAARLGGALDDIDGTDRSVTP